MDKLERRDLKRSIQSSGSIPLVATQRKASITTGVILCYQFLVSSISEGSVPLLCDIYWVPIDSIVIIFWKCLTRIIVSLQNAVGLFLSCRAALVFNFYESLTVDVRWLHFVAVINWNLVIIVSITMHFQIIVLVLKLCLRYGILYAFFVQIPLHNARWWSHVAVPFHGGQTPPFSDMGYICFLGHDSKDTVTDETVFFGQCSTVILNVCISLLVNNGCCVWEHFKYHEKYGVWILNASKIEFFCWYLKR